MKKLSIALVLLVFSFVLLACEQTLAPDIIDFAANQQEVEQLRVWLDDSEGLFMDALLPEFNKVYPNIEVQFQHMGALDSRDRLKTYGVSGNGADVFMFPHDHLSLALAEDLVYTLPTSLYTTLNAKILDVAMDIATAGTRATADPKLYAVPISIESVFIMYNRDLISDAEVEALVTWDDVIAYSATFAAENPGKQLLTTNSHWADNYYLQAFYSAFGWRPHGVDGIDPTEVGFESPALANALTWLTTELKPVVTGNNAHNSAGTTLFEQEVAAMILTGPWAIQGFADKLGRANLGAIPFPSMDGVDPNVVADVKTYAGSQMVAVYKYSQHIDAAVKFVEFLATETAQEILYTTSNDCPALTDLSGISGIATDEFMQVMLTQLATSIPMPTIKEVSFYWAAAETMVINVWNAAADIATEQKKAESSYLASKALGS